MWLINTTSLELEYVHDALSCSYAILSHTWENEEITFQDIRDKDEEFLHSKQGFQKVAACCNQARQDGFQYAWIDTCCIDKTSSAELSEAINSMYLWYQQSAICYAYLSDIPSANSVRDPGLGDVFDIKQRFKFSRWFTRGWTLQELLAPPIVEFYAANWEPFGSRAQLRDEIGKITGINSRALAGEQLFQFNVAEKMSWAAGRQTTRIEDKAYCLLGLFEVNMPLLYGEGDRSFLRLQEHILQSVEDYTIFAWPGRNYDENPWTVTHSQPLQSDQNLASPLLGASESYTFSSLLAHDPDEFKRLDGMKWNYSDLHPIPDHQLKVALYGAGDRRRRYTDFEDGQHPPAVSARGVHLCLPLLHLMDQKYLACLYFECVTLGKWICITLIQNSFAPDRFARDVAGNRGIHFIPYPTKPLFTRCRIYGERLRPNIFKKSAFEAKALDELSQTTMNIKALVLLAKQTAALDSGGSVTVSHAKAVALATRLYGEDAGVAVKVLIGSDDITVDRIRSLDESYSPRDWLKTLEQGADDPRHWNMLYKKGRILQSAEQIRQQTIANSRDLAYQEQRSRPINRTLSRNRRGGSNPERSNSPGVSSFEATIIAGVTGMTSIEVAKLKQQRPQKNQERPPKDQQKPPRYQQTPLPDRQAPLQDQQWRSNERHRTPQDQRQRRRPTESESDYINRSYYPSSNHFPPPPGEYFPRQRDAYYERDRSPHDPRAYGHSSRDRDRRERRRVRTNRVQDILVDLLDRF